MGLILCASVSWAQTYTSTFLSVSPDPSSGAIVSGTVVTLTATVSPSVAGTVSFCDAADVSQCKGVAAILGRAQVTPSGTATFRYTPGTGNHNYYALYAGTASAAASHSDTVPVSIGGGTPYLTVTGTPGNYTFTGNLYTYGGQSLAGQNLSFVDTTNNITLGQVPLSLVSGYPSSSITYGAMVSTPPGFGGNNHLSGVFPGDFDNDGMIEFVQEDQQTSTVNLYKGDASGTWTNPWSYSLPSGCQGWVVSAADLNNDGNLDIVAGCWNNGYSSTIYVFLGNGNDTFRAPISVANGSGDPRPVSYVFGDF
ncbi:MAG: FG-GAP-like repeat-containing protein, partial [Acidobacteriaceae bacterium]|nr:FG-GAP-like repeat-containing protein [Acidobacteriaceae bacterium]